MGFDSNPYLNERYGWVRGFDQYFTGGFEDSDGELLSTPEYIVAKYEMTTNIAIKLLNIIGKTTGKYLRGSKGNPTCRLRNSTREQSSGSRVKPVRPISGSTTWTYTTRGIHTRERNRGI